MKELLFVDSINQDQTAQNVQNELSDLGSTLPVVMMIETAMPLRIFAISSLD